MFGRIKNAKFWLKQFPKWDLNRRNIVGGTALGVAAYIGPKKLEMMKYLISQGARDDMITYNGTSMLMSACMNEDADLDVVKLLLNRNAPINLRIRPRTKMWRAIYLFSTLSFRSGVNKSILMQSLAERQGRTALHYAVRRGDLQLVEILLSMGADPSVKDNAGMSAQDICMSFPELRGLLEKRERKMRLRGTQKRRRVIEALGKRESTATPLRHDMWLITLETVLMLYGKSGRVMDVHQELKREDFLVNWRDTPSDAEIIFVSHEWLSWAHPDPDGDQLRVLCRVLERLRDGELDTEMDPMHTILYKHKFTTKAKDWQNMLKRTYLWVDWFSMPQPGAEKVEDIGEKAMDVLRSEGSKAIRSIPAYVERSDFILILVPSLYHSDRKVPTCYERGGEEVGVCLSCTLQRWREIPRILRCW